MRHVAVGSPASSSAESDALLATAAALQPVVRGTDTIVAGTAVPGGGKAVAVDGGFQVTGRWRFGSGCQESEWMMANFEVSDADGVRRNADGTPALYRGFFSPSECSIIDTW